jgi:hypothetical protein
MIRKLMAAIVVISVPVLSFGVAQVATTGNAWASGNTTCTGTARVLTFAPPGLSDLGNASAGAKSNDKASSAPLTCTSGTTTSKATFEGFQLALKSTTTCSDDSNPPASCAGKPGDYVYGSAGQYASDADTLYQGAKTVDIWFSPHHHPPTCYECPVDNTASLVAGTGTGPENCPSTETGFVLTGHLATSNSEATEITTCLNTDTGTGTSGNFLSDLEAELGGNTGIVVATATATTSVAIS